MNSIARVSHRPRLAAVRKLASIAVPALALAGLTGLAPTAQASPFGVSGARTTAAALNFVGDGSSVLGLEGDDADKAAALTAALRKQLAKRGETQAQDMTMAELMLTMGCEDNDLACMAEGGKSMDTGELIYGKLDGSGGDYTLSLTVLDVEKAKVVNGLTTTLDAAALSGAALDATAADLVSRLLGPAKAGSDTGVTTPVPTGDGGGDAPTGDGDGDGDTTDDPTGEQAPAKKKSGGLEWGLQKPIPKWKLIGLGVSGGLTIAAIGTAVGTSLVIRNPNGSVYKELVKGAEDSLADDNPRNDISPDSSGDLCELARAEPADQPGKVTNAAMTKTCNKADALATTATASYIAGGVFGASTIAFTVLLFVHKKKAPVATLLKHDVNFGFAPRPNGGFSVGGGFRF